MIDDIRAKLRNRNRVKQYRERQAKMGLCRIDVYLRAEAYYALYGYADEKEMGVKDAAASLIQTGLIVEGKVPAPTRFWELVLKKARCCRYR